MSEITNLANETLAYLKRTDHQIALWKGDLTYLEEWEDVSQEAVAQRRAEGRRLAEEADRLIQIHGSHPTLDLISTTGRRIDQELRWKFDLEHINYAVGIHSLILTFLPRYPLVTAEHGERYLEKVRRLPEFLVALETRLRVAVEKGVVPNRTILERMIDGFDRHLDIDSPQDPLLGQAPPTELSPADASAWQRKLATIVVSKVRPAVASLQSVLESSVLPHARSDDEPGLVYLEGGAESYERLVEATVTRPISSAEIHQIGLDQIARLEEEYKLVAGPLLGTTDVGEIYRRLRDDPDLHYTNPEDLVEDATRALGKATDAMADWFGVLPQAPCIATSIDQGALAFYSDPAEDGSQPGTFFFNTSDPSMWGTFQIEATTYHEGIPGHHLQVTLAQENRDLHPIHRDPLSTAFLEGWALYTERLADEMGLYSSELDRVGMLAADSMRACRLVVDTGIHALGWSREEAIDYMVNHSPMTQVQVEGEIDRYIGMPSQALGYMMGRLEIERIRADAESTLGEAFDIKSFHDMVLGHGVVTMASLERRAVEWAAAG